MKIFAIADLHLCLGVDKPMDIFGGEWENYQEKLKINWNNIVGQDDIVIIPGDVSWATYIDEAKKDFLFLESLAGSKIITKGNHDYWWTTMTKMEEFFNKNMIKSISIINTNIIKRDKCIICGTRGWRTPGDNEFTENDKKMFDRELIRLRMALKSVEKVRDTSDKLIVSLHFPPFSSTFEKTAFNEILEEFGVDICVYGHLHGEGAIKRVEGVRDGVCYYFVAADYLKFNPIKIFE